MYVVEAWTTDQVVKWAKEIRGVRAEDIEILCKQAVDGTALLTLTVDKLTRHPYNFLGGPAESLMDGLEMFRLCFAGSTPSTIALLICL